MDTDIRSDIEKLGYEAAQEVAGSDAVEQVEVVAGGDDSDRPVYYFSFLIDQSRARQRAGLVRIRLMQKLDDELLARGDEHRAVIRILDREDWGKRRDARPR